MSVLIPFDRSMTEIVNQYKVSVIADYAYGEYIATQTFFDEMSKIQQSMVKGELVKLSTGQTADPQETGGLIAIQIYTETLESARQAMTGLSKLGLGVEKQVWKNI